MPNWDDFFKDNGFTLDDVNKLFEKKIEELKKKTHIRVKNPSTGFAGIATSYNYRKTGKFVTHIQKSYPIKMFVLQGIDRDEIRIGYYVISLKKLKVEGKLRVVWGQYNPHIPKDDFSILLEKAKKEGVI